MEDHCSPLSYACFYQDEGIEELRHYLTYTSDLEGAILSAKEEMRRREVEILSLKDLLSRTIKERNEAQSQCHKLMLDKAILQQQLSQKQLEDHLQQQQQKIQHLKQETAPVSGTHSSEGESKAADSSNNNTTIPDTNKTVSASQFSAPIPQQQPLQLQLPEVILKLAAEKPLPEKGKLLKAVKEAGPLLQTLLLAGPLPQWQHPPPQLDSIDIPQVTISSPTARIIHQDPFNTHTTACFSHKRGPELCDQGPDSSPPYKCQKVSIH